MRLSEIHSGAVVRCANLKAQHNPLLQSWVKKMNNSFAVILYPPLKRDRVRVRLQWIGDPAVCIGIKAKYLFPVSKIIIHGGPFNRIIEEQDIGWTWKDVRYLWKKWANDPTNTVRFGGYHRLRYDLETRKNILSEIFKDRIINEGQQHYFHYLAVWPRDYLFDDWVNEAFAENSEFTRNVIRHCVQFIYHDHDTLAVKALLNMPYIDADVMRVQNNLRELTNLGYPRYDRLHPRLIFHHFASELVLQEQVDTLWDNLQDDAQSIILMQSLSGINGHANYWKPNDTQNFNVIYPEQTMLEYALLRAKELLNVTKTFVQRPHDVQAIEAVNGGKVKWKERMAAVFAFTRPDIIVAAANTMRSRVKSKMQRTVGVIPTVAYKVWSIMGSKERGDRWNISCQNTITLYESVKAVVGNELKLKIPSDRRDIKPYFQFWTEFAKCIRAEIMKRHWTTALTPLSSKSLEIIAIHRKYDESFLLETLLYWKSLDLTMEPTYDLNVILVEGPEEYSSFSKEHDRIQFANLSRAMGCSELIDQDLVTWIYRK